MAKYVVASQLLRCSGWLLGCDYYNFVQLVVWLIFTLCLVYVSRFANLQIYLFAADKYAKLMSQLKHGLQTNRCFHARDRTTVHV